MINIISKMGITIFVYIIMMKIVSAEDIFAPGVENFKSDLLESILNNTIWLILAIPILYIYYKLKK